MRSGSIQGAPDMHMVAIRKVLQATSPQWCLKVISPEANQSTNPLAIITTSNTGVNGAASIYSDAFDAEWGIRARTHLFLRRFWSNDLIATYLCFVMMLTVAQFSDKSNFFPFQLQTSEYMRSVVFSSLILMAQGVAIAAGILISSQRSADEVTLINVFRRGFEMLQDHKFIVYSIGASLSTCSLLAMSLFIQHRHCLHALFYNALHDNVCAPTMIL